jgi:peptidoglycan/xylan/chitin deacetylase (PgdA/CDA1 family)
MLKRLIKLAISGCVYVWDRLRDSALRLVGKTPPPKAVVLYYHGISENERSGFARQMALLKKSARPIDCAPDELAPGELHAAVTFDDGFVSVIQNALPVLRDHRIPATIFVPTGYLGTAPGWVKEPAIMDRNEIILTASELKALASDPLFSIGSHTVTHPRLALLDRKKIAHELETSKKSLEAIIEAPVELFSLPHGSYTPDVLQVAQCAGYKRVFGIKPAMAFVRQNEFLTGRIAVDPRDWTIEYILKLNGAYRWMARKA